MVIITRGSVRRIELRRPMFVTRTSFRLITAAFTRRHVPDDSVRVPDPQHYPIVYMCRVSSRKFSIHIVHVPRGIVTDEVTRLTVGCVDRFECQLSVWFLARYTTMYRYTCGTKVIYELDFKRDCKPM